MKFIEYTWVQFDNDCELLAEQIINNTVATRFKYIYGIPRGGQIVAIKLSHLTNLEYIPIREDTRLMDAFTTIIIDDIADTGKTLYRYIMNHWCCYTIHYKPQSCVKPMYIREVNSEDWIVYPWEDKNKAKQDYENFMERRK